MSTLIHNTTMHLTRADLLSNAKTKPLHKIQWHHLRGTSRQFAQAALVIVRDGDKALIIKDRNGQYVHVPRDPNGLVLTADIDQGG